MKARVPRSQVPRVRPPRSSPPPLLAGLVRVFFGCVLSCGCSRHTGGRRPAIRCLRARPRIAARVGTHIPSVTGRERLDFAVRVDADLKRIEVELCPSGFRIERLNAPSPGAERLLAGGAISTAEGDYACPGEGVDLPHTRSDECLHYAVELPEQARTIRAACAG